MASVDQAMNIVQALITESFEPVIKYEVQRIIDRARERAKRQIEDEVRNLTEDLAVRIEGMARAFKTRGITIDVAVHLPKEWEKRYGQDAKASKLPDPPIPRSD